MEGSNKKELNDMIVEYRQWMQQRRYADQTISTYFSMLDVFSKFSIDQ